MTENTVKVNLNDSKTNSSHLVFNIGVQSFDHSNTPLINDGIGLTIRNYGLHEENGIVVFLDALGVKGIWRRFRPIDVIKMWNSVNSFFIHSLKQSHSYLNTHPFFKSLSDTIIITIPSKPTYDIVSKTFDLLLEPFIQSLKTRMLLRGTISYGTYYLSERLIIGPALDDAAYHHDKLEWIGISLSPSLSRNVSDINTISGKSIIYYPSIPQKKSSYGGLVLNWPKFDLNNECYSILEEESMKVEASVKPKYNNTFAFYRSAVNLV